MTQITAQILGLLALCVTILCYQFNSQKKILVMQVIASVLFTINLALLDALSGALLNIHGICRALTFYQRGRYRWADSPFWIFFYIVTAGLCVAVTYRSPLDLLPFVGQTFTTLAFFMKDPAKIRLLTLPSPPCWFVYHLSSGNLGGVLNEIFVLCSILVGMFRFDRQKKKKT